MDDFSSSDLLTPNIAELAAEALGVGIGGDVVPSDAEVKKAIFDILAESDKNTVTKKILKSRIEEIHGWKAENIKGLINECLEEFFAENSNEIDPENIVEDEDYSDDEEEQEDDNDFNSEPRNSFVRQEKRKGGGFAAPVRLSWELSEFLGQDLIPRTQVTKLIWNYIKANNLQNPAKKSEILCDAAMQKVFKKEKFTMFQMTKYLSKMMKAPHEIQRDHNVVESNKRKVGDDEETTSPKKKAAPAKSSSNGEGGVKYKGFARPVLLGPELSNFFHGTEVLLRSEVTKIMWSYIRKFNLQHPNDRREILCDDQLKALFNRDKITIFELTKFLNPMMKSTDQPPADVYELLEKMDLVDSYNSKQKKEK